MEDVIEESGNLESSMDMVIINLKMEKKEKVFGYKVKMYNGLIIEQISNKLAMYYLIQLINLNRNFKNKLVL